MAQNVNGVKTMAVAVLQMSATGITSGKSRFDNDQPTATNANTNAKFVATIQLSTAAKRRRSRFEMRRILLSCPANNLNITDKSLCVDPSHGSG